MILTKNGSFWLRFDWDLNSIIWDRGGNTPASNLYALTKEDDFVELNVDNPDEVFPISLETNEQILPTGSIANAVYVYSDNNKPLTIRVKGNEPEREITRTFTPKLGNRYRQGIHIKGRNISIKLESQEQISIDRIIIAQSV